MPCRNGETPRGLLRVGGHASGRSPKGSTLESRGGDAPCAMAGAPCRGDEPTTGGQPDLLADHARPIPAVGDCTGRGSCSNSTHQRSRRISNQAGYRTGTMSRRSIARGASSAVARRHGAAVGGRRRRPGIRGAACICRRPRAGRARPSPERARPSSGRRRVRAERARPSSGRRRARAERARPWSWSRTTIVWSSTRTS
jgi:hypothetical protein